MADPRIAQEDRNELLHSKGLQQLFLSGFKPKLDELKSELLTNRELSEGDRRGYITARNLILEGFSDLFTKADIHLPNWLELELN